MKLLSIIILSGGRLDLLKHTIVSLIDTMTYPLWEMIIYNHQEGQAKGWLKLIDSVSGEYILNCEDDWFFMNPGDWVQDAIDILEKNPDVGIVRLRKGGDGQTGEKMIKTIDRGFIIDGSLKGFTLNPFVAKTEVIRGLRNKIKPDEGNIEGALIYYYDESKYQTAKLDYYLTGVCKHIGVGRSLLGHTR